MHVLFVADGDSKYGAVNSLYQMIEELIKRKSNIKVSVVLTRRSDRKKDFQKLGCNVYKIPYEPFYQGIPESKWKIPVKFVIRGIQYFFGRLFAVSILEKKLDIHTIDIIHSNSSREDFGAALAKKYHIPFIWHIREFGDLDYSCYSYRKNYIKYMNQTATEFIAISEAVKKHWIQKGISAEKIIMIYNGVAENKFVKKQYSNEPGVLRLVIMGSLCETKGQHCLIEAIAKLPQNVKQKIRLDIVGSGNKLYCHKLENMTKNYQLSDQIHFYGYIKDFYKNLSQYDCGVMCSKSEGFGRVTAEYMMAGLPVIASDTGANPEIIRNRENGLLYHCGDSQSLAEQIEYLYNNISMIETLGKSGRSYALQQFTASTNANAIYEEYKKIV